MPELPEVETVKNSLKIKLVGKKIEEVTVLYPNIIEYPEVTEFKNQIKNQTVRDLDRYGKWIIFVLDDYYLLSHLRMEGKYFFKTQNDKLLKHEHIIFNLDDDTQLRYMDVRKFGKMHLILKKDIKKVGPFLNMGLEPWDKKLTIDYLKAAYKTRKLPIKSILLVRDIATFILA